MLKGIGQFICRLGSSIGWDKRKRLSDRNVMRTTMKVIRSEEFSRSSLTGSPLARGEK